MESLIKNKQHNVSKYLIDTAFFFLMNVTANVS